jgi:hypothetical protein
MLKSKCEAQECGTHYVTFTPWNATDQERGVNENKKFGYDGVVIQSQDADIF